AVSLAKVGPTPGAEHDGAFATRSSKRPANPPLSARQSRVLGALSSQFRKVGEEAGRPDADWGFRPVGNAILAFGAEGSNRLQAMMDEKTNRRLSDLAWQVEYVRQSGDRFVPLGDG